MRSRTQSGTNGSLWQWLDGGRRIWTYWRIRRATRRYLLLVPRTDVGDLMQERDPYNGRRVYVLIRFPDSSE